MLFALSLLIASAAANQWDCALDFSAKISFGVDFYSPSEGYTCGVNDGSSLDLIVRRTEDAGSTWKFLDAPDASGTFFLTGMAASDKTSAMATGIAIGGSAHQFTSDGAKMQRGGANDGFLMTETQDLKKIGDKRGNFAATGTFATLSGSVDGVSMTTDGGASFKNIDWQLSVNFTTWPRYGSFPSENTWYLTGGSWSKDGERESFKSSGHLSEILKVNYDAKSSQLSMEALFDRKFSRADDYTAVVQKTTDGGKTFTNVYADIGNGYYFNDIACPTEDVCFVVAEGNMNTFILRTVDAGASWERVYSGDRETIMPIVAKSRSEVAVGGMDASYQGVVISTKDGGATWTKDVLPGYMPNAMSSSGSNMFATAFKFPEGISGFCKYV